LCSHEKTGDKCALKLIKCSDDENKLSVDNEISTLMKIKGKSPYLLNIVDSFDFV
jgi:serine/threonine protein kinase